MAAVFEGCITWALQGEDEVRQSGVSFAIVRPCALTEEPAGAELVLSQGDTIKVFLHSAMQDRYLH